MRKNAGFTLIELSIVLVIIGLIIGGVLVGQDLIKGAEVRATVSQFEKYDAAANAFRNKYAGLPGDVLSPTKFGFDTTDLIPNGNGRIDRIDSDGNDVNNNTGNFLGESAAFFRHLAQAGLIADNIAAIASFDSPMPGLSDLPPVPSGKISPGAYIFALQVSGRNKYMLAKGAQRDDENLVLFLSTGGTDPELRVIDAYQMDSKMDDGVATTGRVAAYSDFVTLDAGGTCHTSGVYNTAASANDPTCMLQIRTSF